MTEEKRERILEAVRDELPDMEFEELQVEKNNQTIREGISICEKEGYVKTVIYWDDMAGILGENCTEEEATAYIKGQAAEHLPLRVDRQDILGWERARKWVYKKVVHYGRNKERLCLLAHRRYLDLAEVFYLRLSLEGKGIGTGEVRMELLNKWGISLEELAGQAEKNMEADGYRIISLEELLQLPPKDRVIPFLYLIQNESQTFGAAAITSPKIMKEAMEKIGRDCYILPSSIHEILACPYDESVEVGELRKLVREVNETVLAAGDFLSDSVYYCYKDTGEVDIC